MTVEERVAQLEVLADEQSAVLDDVREVLNSIEDRIDKTIAELRRKLQDSSVSPMADSTRPSASSASAP